MQTIDAIVVTACGKGITVIPTRLPGQAVEYEKASRLLCPSPLRRAFEIAAPVMGDLKYIVCCGPQGRKSHYLTPSSTNVRVIGCTI